MRKIITIMTIITMLAFSGCVSSPSPTQPQPQSESPFVIVGTYYGYRIVYHKDTKVMYTVSRDYYNDGSFTLLVNPDGSPMLWEGDTE